MGGCSTGEFDLPDIAIRAPNAQLNSAARLYTWARIRDNRASDVSRDDRTFRDSLVTPLGS